MVKKLSMHEILKREFRLIANMPFYRVGSEYFLMI